MKIGYKVLEGTLYGQPSRKYIRRRALSREGVRDEEQSSLGGGLVSDMGLRFGGFEGVTFGLFYLYNRIIL